MKLMFYPKLALDGIRKNKRLFAPYILTGSVMVMMYYILSFLAASELLEHMRGGGTLRMMLPFGRGVIGIFSLIFLFYTNSLLIRQRNQEFGLYNILGMDKGNLSRIMFWESITVAAVSILCGLVLGIGLSKLAELAMLNIMNETVTYELRIDWLCARDTVIFYLGVYLILLIHALIKVARSRPLELLRSSQVGEKPPKVNWLFAALGLVILAAAYYLAVSIQDPLDAMMWFFVAVVMVILATYLLFIAGSVALCRLLQKNKRYYYRPNHFVSVSSMAYRMKRNGAGLASICILLTMVLVTLSSTTSLYIGQEDSLNTRYPRDISMSLELPDMEAYCPENFDAMREAVNKRVTQRENVIEYGSASVAGLFTPEGILTNSSALNYFDMNTYNSVGYLEIISLEDYNRIMGTNETLETDECLLYCERTEFTGSTFAVSGGAPLMVKAVLERMYVPGNLSMQMVPAIILVTSDFRGVVEPLMSLMNPWEEPSVELLWNYGFDMDVPAQEQIEAYDRLRHDMDEIVIRSENGGYSYRVDGKEAERADFYGTYGGLFFVGVLLSAVFLFAAVLIIYYKQISEGFEDQKRFDVMQKVGMTRREIRRSINSQVLTVFFLPLLMAGAHLAFAFPLVWKILMLFNLRNEGLLIATTAGCFVLFGLLYALVYRITSNVYFSIVSGARENG